MRLCATGFGQWSVLWDHTEQSQVQKTGAFTHSNAHLLNPIRANHGYLNIPVEECMMEQDIMQPNAVINLSLLLMHPPLIHPNCQPRDEFDVTHALRFDGVPNTSTRI
jgi:hypothetical protein